MALEQSEAKLWQLAQLSLRQAAEAADAALVPHRLVLVGREDVLQLLNDGRLCRRARRRIVDHVRLPALLVHEHLVGHGLQQAVGAERTLQCGPGTQDGIVRPRRANVAHAWPVVATYASREAQQGGGAVHPQEPLD